MASRIAVEERALAACAPCSGATHGGEGGRMEHAWCVGWRTSSSWSGLGYRGTIAAMVTQGHSLLQRLTRKRASSSYEKREHNHM